MAKFGWPYKFINMVSQLQDGMFAGVLYDGDLCEPFEVITDGAKQGCILFIMLFSVMLYCALHGSGDGVRIRYRTDGKLFNLNRLSVKTKMKQDVVRDFFLFADDRAVSAMHKVERGATLPWQVSRACGDCLRTMSTIKTEVMFHPALRERYTSPELTSCCW